MNVATGTGNRISANRIYSNGALGIDLNAAGVLANSACQSNTNGANLLQNAPALTAGTGTTFVTATATDANGNTSEFSNCAAATLAGNILDIAGALNSLPSTTYTVEYFSNPSCDPSGYGQGQTFLGSTTVTTGSSCNAPIVGVLDLTSADLAVTNTPTPASFAVNVPGSPPFTSVVTNAGPKAATGVVWTDVLPANVAYVSATTTQGACTFTNQTIACNLGNLRVGGKITVSVTLTVTAAGTFSNTMSVTSSTPDDNPANNSATASLTAKYLPYLDHLTPASVNVGSPATTVTVIGQGLMPTSVVSVNGTVYPATFTANWNPGDCGNNAFGQPTTYCTALSIALPASLFAAVTSVPVTVNGASGSLTFSVVTPPVVPGPVTHFVLSGFGSSVAAGAMELLYITAEDANGLTVPTYLGTVTLTTTDPAPTVFTAGGGTATVTFTASEAGMADTIIELQTTGTQSVTATDVSNAAIKGTIATNVAYGPASNLTLTGSPQAAAPNHAFAQPLSVTVTDEYGNLVPNRKITFTAPTSGASAILSGTTATTNSLGVASVTAEANSISGTYSVGVTFGAGIAGGGDNADVFLLNNGAGLATLTATGGTPQSTFAGQLFPTKLQAQLLDGLNNPISGATVWFNSAGAVLSGSAVTDSKGNVAVTANAPSNAVAATYPTTATVGGLTATFMLTIKTPLPVIMTASGGTPQTAAVGSVFAAPLSVTVTDGWGNPRSGVVVTYIPPTSGASAALSAGTASTNGSGIASVTATANQIQGTYNVSASVGGITVYFVLTNGPAVTGPPASISAYAGTQQSQTINLPFATAFQAQVKNSGGTPLPGVSVTFSAPSSGASGTFSGSATTVTNSAGIATAPLFTANSVAGNYVVTASAGTLSTTFSLSNLPGAPAALNMYAGNNQSATVNTAFGTALAVQLVDAYGNGVGSGSVMLLVSPATNGASGTFSGSTTITTGSNGVATASTLTANGTAGVFDVTALVFSGSSYFYQSFTLTNTTAVPAALIAVSGTPQSTFVGTVFPAALSAKVTDAGGTPLAGFTVTFTVPSSGASAILSSPSAITNASGIATVNAVANGALGSYTVMAAVGTHSASFALVNMSKCDVNSDSFINVADVQQIINEALGGKLAADDLNRDGVVSVVEAQIVINAILSFGCMAK